MGTAVSSDGPNREVRYYKKDFWREENLKFDRVHYRMEKAARVINKVVHGRDCELLDVGCGPAALRQVLPGNIRYHGIDIAIQEPADYLIEADFLEAPIKFRDKKFDVVLAQGVFEYMGEHQAQKFDEIARLLKAGGTFIATYVNFAHRNREVYKPYSNVQPISSFRADLSRNFVIRRSFPTSHNWGHSEPNKKVVRTANIHLNASIPLISKFLAVEYFFICSPRRPVSL